MKKNLFREAALRKLRDPEEMDTLLVPVRPAHWQIFVALGTVLALLLVWSFLGNVSTVVNGQGILLREGAVMNVISPGSGRIAAVLVEVDRQIISGQPVAMIEQPELRRRLDESRRQLALLREYREELRRDPDLANRKEEMEVDLRIIAEETELLTLRERLENESFVRAASGGRVTEILRSPGQIVQEGDAILSLENEGEEKPLQVQAFVQPEQGKKILVGMEARISPSVVRQEEFGFLVGRVVQVSSFPASAQGMLNILGNPGLVQSLSQGGAPIAVTVALDRADTESGYRWTSKSGPPLRLQSGTLCRIAVTVRRQPPVTLVLPALKGLFAGDAPEVAP